MNICILGKYPPIEGGVSTHTYWLARGLAGRGHQVHVVTNADEVEDMFRMTLEPRDAPWHEPRFEEGGGRVQVLNPEPFSRLAMGHIPEGNPFVSKLASVATDVVRHEGCDVILSYYYEPYGVAGWLGSQWTGRPLILKHAGSDLDRLMRVPDLATTYKEVLRSADAVVTQRRLMPRFLGMGVRRDRLRDDVAYGIPTGVFHADAPPLDVDRLALDIGIRAPRPFDAGLPTIGVYGKIGRSKGTFDLLSALGQLAHEGRHFNFVAMVGEAQGRLIAQALREQGLSDCSHVLPMLANWRVPELLRLCTAACFLERDFPVEIHGPIIAREILACGTCLLLSGEIASKQRYRDQLVHGHNVLVVEDPRDIAALADALRRVIDDPVQARAIGARGGSIAEAIGDHGSYIEQWEALLKSFVRSAPASLAPGRTQPPEHPAQVLEGLDTTLPDLLHYLRARFPALCDAYLSQAEPGPPRDGAQRFCRFFEKRLPRDALGEQTPKLMSALRYARARVQAAHAPEADTPPFPVVDALQGRPVEAATVGALHPVRGHAVRIETFDHDVSALFCMATLFGQPTQAPEDVDRALAAAPARPTLVLFQRTPNLVPCELHIDTPTRELVEACDGSRTTEALIEYLCRRFGASSATERTLVGERLLAALARLYRAGVIAFGERRPGWGWTGGPRAPLSALRPDHADAN